jgi:hypothetical protein
MVEFGMHDAQIDAPLFQDYWAVWPNIIDEVITFGGTISGGCNTPAALL